MNLFCEDHRVAVAVIPSISYGVDYDPMFAEDVEHMDCELSDPNWEDSDYDRDIDFG